VLQHFHQLAVRHLPIDECLFGILPLHFPTQLLVTLHLPRYRTIHELLLLLFRNALRV
jgi:hypothetical protein